MLGALLERGRLPSGTFSVAAYHGAFGLLLASAGMAFFCSLLIKEPRPD